MASVLPHCCVKEEAQVQGGHEADGGNEIFLSKLIYDGLTLIFGHYFPKYRVFFIFESYGILNAGDDTYEKDPMVT